MKKLMFVIAFAICSISAFAVLPPFYQSSKEIKRIINDARTHEMLGSAQMILDIKKEDGGWVITTQNYELHIDIIYQLTEHLGPAVFELEYHEPVEINS